MPALTLWFCVCDRSTIRCHFPGWCFLGMTPKFAYMYLQFSRIEEAQHSSCVHFSVQVHLQPPAGVRGLNACFGWPSAACCLACSRCGSLLKYLKGTLLGWWDFATSSCRGQQYICSNHVWFFVPLERLLENRKYYITTYAFTLLGLPVRLLQCGSVQMQTLLVHVS